MVRILAIIFILIIPYPIFCQYLDFRSVEKLPSSVNSDDEEIMPLLSPDGRTLFFSRVLHEGNVGGRFSGSDVWTSSFQNGTWEKAKNPSSPFNTKDNNAVIGISTDGKVAYLFKGSSSKKLGGVYFSRKNDDTWGHPEFIPIQGMTNLGFAGFYVSPDFDVIIVSMNGVDSKGEEDLYISVKDGAGNWSKARNMGPAINSAGFESAPFLSADKKRLYFTSNGHGGYGDADIFFSDRLYSSYETWSAPYNLGPSVNTKTFDSYFSIYGDTLAYFVSNRESKLSDIYKARVIVRSGNPLKSIVYLNDNEVSEVLGKNVKRKIEFQAQDTKLTATQRELIWYIAGRLIGNKEIRVILTFSKSDDPEIAAKRLTAVTSQLVTAGLEGSRIERMDDSESDSPFPREEIGLVLVK